MVVGDLLLHPHQFIAAGYFFLLGHVTIELCRRRVGLERIGEHAGPFKFPLPHKVHEFFKLRAGLAGKPSDKRRAHGEVGNAAAKLFQECLGRRTRHATLHPLQDGIARVLQWHVEVGNDPLARGNRVDEPVGEIHWVEIHQPNPLNAVDGLKLLEQLHQAWLTVTVHAVIGCVLGDDDQLLHAVCGQFAGLSHDLLNRLRGVLASHLGDRTKRACPVAAFRNLEIRHVPRRDSHSPAVFQGRRGGRTKDASLFAQAANQPLGRPRDLISRENADHRVDPR